MNAETKGQRLLRITKEEQVRLLEERTTLRVTELLSLAELEKKEHCMLIFRVVRLKKIVKKYKATHTKNIGDYNASKCVVIPIKELFNEGCYSI